MPTDPCVPLSSSPTDRVLPRPICQQPDVHARNTCCHEPGAVLESGIAALQTSPLGQPGSRNGVVDPLQMVAKESSARQPT
jgi:hypothetical protein